MYPVTHLPGIIAFKAKISRVIRIGARNPSVFSMVKSYVLKLKQLGQIAAGYLQAFNKPDSLFV